MILSYNSNKNLYFCLPPPPCCCCGIERKRSGRKSPGNKYLRAGCSPSHVVVVWGEAMTVVNVLCFVFVLSLSPNLIAFLTDYNQPSCCCRCRCSCSRWIFKLLLHRATESNQISFHLFGAWIFMMNLLTKKNLFPPFLGCRFEVSSERDENFSPFLAAFSVKPNLFHVSTHAWCDGTRADKKPSNIQGCSNPRVCCRNWNCAAPYIRGGGPCSLINKIRSPVDFSRQSRCFEQSESFASTSTVSTSQTAQNALALFHHQVSKTPASSCKNQ